MGACVEKFMAYAKSAMEIALILFSLL